jgi:hypothetical protein
MTYCSVIDFGLLPELVTLKILKFLKSSLSDIENLKQVNRHFNSIINYHFHLLYYEHLNIDNKTIHQGLRLDRPILSFEMTCYAERLTMPKYHIDPQR